MFTQGASLWLNIMYVVATNTFVWNSCPPKHRFSHITQVYYVSGRNDEQRNRQQTNIKQQRTEPSSSHGTMSTNLASNTPSNAANMVASAQPLGFMLTKVTGVARKHNTFHSIDIKGWYRVYIVTNWIVGTSFFRVLQYTVSLSSFADILSINMGQLEESAQVIHQNSSCTVQHLAA